MKEKMITISVAIVFVISIFNVAMLVYFYKQYADSINSLTQQNWLTKVKIENLEKDADTFKNTLEALNTQVRTYDTNNKTMSSVVQNIRTVLDGWQKKQDVATNKISELANKTDMLATTIADFRKSFSDAIDLGKIQIEGSGQGVDVGVEAAQSSGN